MQDLPEAPELLDAVAAYLLAELRPSAPREQRFRVLVAANVCALVARELRIGDRPSREDLASFRLILDPKRRESAPAAVPDQDDPEAEARAAAAELAGRIRAGLLDDRLEQTITLLRDHVRRKLEIARPGYAD
jgi:hypothetical protein